MFGSTMYTAIPMETTSTTRHFDGVTLSVIDCDGKNIWLKGSNSETYTISAQGDAPLRCLRDQNMAEKIEELEELVWRLCEVTGTSVDDLVDDVRAYDCDWLEGR